MNPKQLRATAQFILNQESRRDSKGRLVVYKLPAGDGGGTFEVAGINDRYDHAIAYDLRRMIMNGDHAAAEALALDYYVQNTNSVAGWSTVPAIEAFLRDAAFNRGSRGSARILQRALGVVDDGVVGPKTLKALRVAEKNPSALIDALHAACRSYELQVAPPVGARRKFWKGLNNRWQARADFARTLL